MSIDVEDWFHVENLKSAIDRSTWETRERRVEANTDRLLSLFDRTGTTATFFVLGWVAERHAQLVRRIATAGHEVASHGTGHQLVYELSPEQFRDDVRRSKSTLEDIAGTEVRGYRAPNFSITVRALEILAEEGFSYDSSVFPTGMHDRYAPPPVELIAGADANRSPDPFDRFSVRLTNGLIEYPVLTRRLIGRHVPWGGGGYFRLFPAGVFRRGFATAGRHRGGAVFYLHPWEIDPGQPRVEGIPRLYRFRHYVNLGKTEARLDALCRAIPFTSFSAVST